MHEICVTVFLEFGVVPREPIREETQPTITTRDKKNDTMFVTTKTNCSLQNPTTNQLANNLSNKLTGFATVLNPHKGLEHH
jgi:hypothetical protein